MAKQLNEFGAHGKNYSEDLRHNFLNGISPFYSFYQDVVEKGDMSHLDIFDELMPLLEETRKRITKRFSHLIEYWREKDPNQNLKIAREILRISSSININSIFEAEILYMALKKFIDEVNNLHTKIPKQTLEIARKKLLICLYRQINCKIQSSKN
jgi:hypothetical protein